jgi:PLP dependent protein
MVAENVKNLQDRIASQCKLVGRNPAEITMIAVTKTYSIDHIQEAVHAGLYHIGENYVQEMQEKHNSLHDDKIKWHFIGHLQTNKVKYIIDWVYFIHSVDSLSLAQEISKRAERIGQNINTLVEVNTSGEESKYGIFPDQTEELVKSIVKLPHINLDGLMTIGPFLPDPESSRPAFRMLKEIKQNIEQKGIPLRHLSMGMSNDFEVAIEEGATMLRIGTAIFGQRK